MTSERNSEARAPRPRRAVGLAYEGGASLPRVVVKAVGEPAEALLHRERWRTPVVEDDLLSRALFRLPIDASIGRELFEVVAAVLVHIVAVDAEREALDA